MSEEIEISDPQERFQNFFKTEEYRKRLSQMAMSAQTSLVVAFEDLLAFDQKLAEELLDKPEEYLKHASNAAFAQLQIEDPEYAERIPLVDVRLVGLLEVAPLRKLGSEQIGKIVMVEGIVVRASPVRPMVMQGAFRCKRCGTITPVNQTGSFLKAPFACSSPDCGSQGPYEFVQEESTFIDSQELRIQERPEDLPPGQLPRTLGIKLVGKEIVDVARPGDDVSVVGQVCAQPPTLPGVGKLRAFILHLDANSIEVLGKEPETAMPSPEEEEKILELARDPWIHQKIINSIAPSIYGYDHIKEAIMYLLFGGVPKNLPDITIRGEMNALLIGDPGTAKSQLLQYVSRIAPRGLYTSGRGTTAAGLTAAVIREKGGGMSLEAGALVLADKGIACIDEMDKMRPEDRVAIHEAMEQHTVSVAKGGIVATLNARTAILAAANPTLGRYEPHRTVAENISLPVTILSRFDLIFVLRDVPNKESDGKMSMHILELHRKGSSPVEPPISAELLRKYISYA
ncbi:MAG TPA: minichromosome maintenance protein MCM, partial [Patescibacteria group bacterium]|nr:minichromosome maintenance protein MCM [Patescibacteria group bacterium]